MNHYKIARRIVLTFLGSLYFLNHAAIAEALPPLPAPYNLRVVSSTPHSLSLQWNFAVTGMRVGGFVLYRATGIVGADDAALQPWKYFYDYESSWTDPTVQPGVTYTYNLRSYLNGYGPLGISQGSLITVTAPSLPSPTGFTVDSVGPKFVSLKWNFSSSSDVDGLVLYRAPGIVGREDTSFIPWKYFYSSESQWVDPTVEPGKKYSYKILSYKIGNGISSVGPTNFLSTEIPAMPTPSGVVSLRGANSVKLTWQFLSLGFPVDGLAVFRSPTIVADGNDPSFVVYKYLGANDKTWTDTTITDGQYYTYKILAYKNGVGNSAVNDSNLTFVGPSAPAIEPSSPSVTPPSQVKIISSKPPYDLEISARISVAPGTSGGLVAKYSTNFESHKEDFYIARFYRRQNAAERNSVSLWLVSQGVWKKIALVNVALTGGKLTLKSYQDSLMVNFNDQTLILAGPKEIAVNGFSLSSPEETAGTWSSDLSRPAIFTELKIKSLSDNFKSSDFMPSANLLVQINVWQMSTLKGSDGSGLPFFTGTNLINNNSLPIVGPSFTQARYSAAIQGRMCPEMGADYVPPGDARYARYAYSGPYAACVLYQSVFYALNRPLGPCNIPLTMKRVDNYASPGNTEVFFKDRAALPGEIRTGLFLCRGMDNTFRINIEDVSDSQSENQDSGTFQNSYGF